MVMDSHSTTRLFNEVGVRDAQSLARTQGGLPSNSQERGMSEDAVRHEFDDPVVDSVKDGKGAEKSAGVKIDDSQWKYAFSDPPPQFQQTYVPNPTGQKLRVCIESCVVFAQGVGGVAQGDWFSRMEVDGFWCKSEGPGAAPSEVKIIYSHLFSGSGDVTRLIVESSELSREIVKSLRQTLCTPAVRLMPWRSKKVKWVENHCHPHQNALTGPFSSVAAFLARMNVEHGKISDGTWCIGEFKYFGGSSREPREWVLRREGRHQER